MRHAESGRRAVLTVAALHWAAVASLVVAAIGAVIVVLWGNGG